MGDFSTVPTEAPVNGTPLFWKAFCLVTMRLGDWLALYSRQKAPETDEEGR